ncbi:hypothetical protein [Gordonia sihwensis]|uniref:hypothetical protein n=1 Tax=Gordonia sihwensis TaxID=173559 RepID=UPI0005EE4765|nr:hypothetical protein [Gordonia sihwensis]KJR10525.1 hypothetical protein UG54_00575 [Gordonia sihwensis]
MLRCRQRALASTAQPLHRGTDPGFDAKHVVIETDTGDEIQLRDYLDDCDDVTGSTFTGAYVDGPSNDRWDPAATATPRRRRRLQPTVRNAHRTPRLDMTITHCGWNSGRVSSELGRFLTDLANYADIPWCTAWEEEPRLYRRALGVPDWPWLTFPSFDDPRMWKLSAIEPAIGDRPVWWFDDEHADESIQ